MGMVYELNEELLQDSINISTGLFHPLDGFMNSHDYYSVIESLTLTSGAVWTIPIGLDVDHKTYLGIQDSEALSLSFNSKIIGYIEVADKYVVDSKKDVIKIYGTDDSNHPGVKKELSRHKYRVGGKIVITDDALLKNSLIISIYLLSLEKF